MTSIIYDDSVHSMSDICYTHSASNWGSYFRHFSASQFSCRLRCLDTHYDDAKHFFFRQKKFIAQLEVGAFIFMHWIKSKALDETNVNNNKLEKKNTYFFLSSVAIIKDVSLWCQIFPVSRDYEMNKIDMWFDRVVLWWEKIAFFLRKWFLEWILTEAIHRFRLTKYGISSPLVWNKLNSLVPELFDWLRNKQIIVCAPLLTSRPLTNLNCAKLLLLQTLKCKSLELP